MNMWVSASPTTSPSVAHAIRQRLMGKPKPVQMAPRLDAVVPALPAPATGGRPKKIIRRPRADADEHVREYRLYLLTGKETLLVGEYIKMRCLQLRMCPDLLIVKKSRERPVVVVRQALMIEVRIRYPRLSVVHIGRIFNVDHTSVLHALRKAGIVASPISRVTPEMSAEMRRLYAEGMQKKAIGKLLGVSGTTVTSHVDPEMAEVQRKRVKDCKRRAAEAKRAERK